MTMFAPDYDAPRRLLAACPAYAATPVVELDGGLRAKDETGRMNLGAFKALGGVYAVARIVADAWHSAGNAALAPAAFTSPEVKDFARAMTFTCASAGNHGMAVAAGARLFGARARIHLAATVPQSFAERLEAKGATVVRSGATYEESIAAAIAEADAMGAIHLADGSWPGYTERPALVMEGYTVIAAELRDQLAGNLPRHVALQAGVGGFAAAIAQGIRDLWPEQPRILVVEPDAAPCIAASLEAGTLTHAGGPVSDMGRLDCKDASLLAFEALRTLDVSCIAVSDAQAIAAAGELAAQGLPTTSSGAAGLAGLKAAGIDPRDALVVVTETA